MVQSKTILAAAAATAGVAFLGYCVYFDRKRRSDPDFKKKLRERRKKNKKGTSSAGSNVQFPDGSDPQALQRFFLEEVTKGEECLAAGQIDEGVEHLSYAVTVCGQPQQLLEVLRQTLPPQVFQMLLQKLATQQHRVAAVPTPPVPSGPSIAELDVE